MNEASDGRFVVRTSGCSSGELPYHDAMTNTVLIVDDHPTFRSIARALLEGERFQVVGESPDGTSAIVAAGFVPKGELSGDVIRELLVGAA